MGSPEVSANESSRGGDVSGMSQTSDPDGWIERHYGTDDAEDSGATKECEEFGMVIPGGPPPMEADAEEGQKDETKEGEKTEKKKPKEKKGTTQRMALQNQKFHNTVQDVLSRAYWKRSFTNARMYLQL